LGKSLDLIVLEKLRERHWERYGSAMETGITRYGSDLLVVPAIKNDRSRLSVESSIILLKDDTGKSMGTAALIRGVTECWRKEKELEEKLAASEV
jgi:hypothetical protein